MKKNTLYCVECRHFCSRDCCDYPDNREYKNTPIRKVRTYKKAASELNSNNDCKWFKQRSYPKPFYARMAGT